MSSFGDGAVAALKSQVDALGEAGKAGLAIDLRGTADGTPDDGIAAARLFIKSGTLAVLGRTQRHGTKEITAAAGDGAFAMPVVLMVSNGTANAAESLPRARAQQTDDAGRRADGGHRRRTAPRQTARGSRTVDDLCPLPQGRRSASP
jgi:C-terminal processing protease CtpA/Prc